MGAQVRGTYGGSIAAFLVGAVGIALPWFVVNSQATKIIDTSAQVSGLEGSFFVLVALGVVAAPGDSSSTPPAANGIPVVPEVESWPALGVSVTAWQRRPIRDVSRDSVR